MYELAKDLNYNIVNMGKSMIGFHANIDKDKIWDIYLNSFTDEENPIFRVRREYDCSTCRYFIKTVGSLVFIDEEYNLHTIFELKTENSTYQRVMDNLDKYVRSCAIDGAYRTDRSTVGAMKTIGYYDGKTYTFEHFFALIPENLVVRKDKVNEEVAKSVDNKNVLERSLNELSLDSVNTVLELIKSDSIYRGQEWLANIEEFKKLHSEYKKVGKRKLQNFLWYNSAKSGIAVARIKNTAIGTLLEDISKNVDLDAAVRAYESVVAPTNYKRPKPIYTKKMLDDARKQVEKLGYMDSLPRRFAVMDDITVNNILFVDRDVKDKSFSDVFGSMEEELPVNPKSFGRVEEISVDKFIENVLPTAKKIEAFMQRPLGKNLMSLIAPVNKEAKTMFKWNNGFSWAYNGNLADSNIRENVKAAGGDVTGVLRFSIQWNDGTELDKNDLDAHCILPNGKHIYFGNKKDRYGSECQLDVDIINPKSGTPAVENITFPDKKYMPVGEYKFYVHCYTNRGGKSGFRAEIEADGEVHNYDFTIPLKGNESVQVAKVMYDGNQLKIEDILKTNISSTKIWNISTNHFVPVTMIMKSPNYWDGQDGNGNLHYMFMLKDCINPDTPNGFFNEYLNNDLMKNKRVFEALGSKMAVENSDNQLSGLGFSSTMRNELTVRVTGNTVRIMKIKF